MTESQTPLLALRFGGATFKLYVWTQRASCRAASRQTGEASMVPCKEGRLSPHCLRGGVMGGRQTLSVCS